MRLVAAVLTGLLALAPAIVQADAKGELEGRALFKEGNRKLEQGDYASALELFRSAYARFPNAKILLNIGTTLRMMGREAEAAETYERYLKDPKAEAKRKAEVQGILKELARRLAVLRIELTQAGSRVRVDARLFEASGAALQVRVDAGTHTVVAEKDGFYPATLTVTIGAGEEKRVELKLVRQGGPEPARPPEPVRPPEPARPPEPVRPAEPMRPPEPVKPAEPGKPDTTPTVTRQAPPPPKERFLTFGAQARTDIDGMGRGAIGVVGLFLGLGQHVDVGVAGLIGKSKGVEIAGTGYILKGAWRPLVVLGFPMFFLSGVHAGIHAGAGVEWRFLRYLGVFATVGVEYFFTVPKDEAKSYVKTVFVPSVGVQGRL